MKNGFVLAALVLTLIAFVAMMQVKTEVQTMDGERQRLVRERAELRETKRVLEAEWALLASPAQLQVLADRAGKSYVNGSSLAHVPFLPPIDVISASDTL